MAMYDEQKQGAGLASVVHNVVSLVPKDVRELVGKISGILLIIAVPVAIILVVMILYNLKQISRDVPCWQVQVINNRVFKVNACTGELSEMPELSPRAAAKSASAKSAGNKAKPAAR